MSTGAIVNQDQADAWDGDEGAHWAANADRYNEAVAAYDEPLFAAARIRPGDAVLDVGCGCGFTTRAAARRAPAGYAHGVDLSSPMLRVATQRALDEGLTNVTFARADAQVERFAPVEVVISRFGAMFFADLAAAFANICRAIRPGGRFATVAWTDLARNDWLTAVRGALAAGRDLPAPPVGAAGPFGLGDADRTRAWLTTAGFVAITIEEERRPFRLGADAVDADAFMATTLPVRSLLEGLDATARTSAFDRFRTMLQDHEGPDGVHLGSSAWVIAATRA